MLEDLGSVLSELGHKLERDGFDIDIAKTAIEAFLYLVTGRMAGLGQGTIRTADPHRIAEIVRAQESRGYALARMVSPPPEIAQTHSRTAQPVGVYDPSEGICYVTDRRVAGMEDDTLPIWQTCIAAHEVGHKLRQEGKRSRRPTTGEIGPDAPEHGLCGDLEFWLGLMVFNSPEDQPPIEVVRDDILPELQRVGFAPSATRQPMAGSYSSHRISRPPRRPCRWDAAYATLQAARSATTEGSTATL